MGRRVSREDWGELNAGAGGVGRPGRQRAVGVRAEPGPTSRVRTRRGAGTQRRHAKLGGRACRPRSHSNRTDAGPAPAPGRGAFKGEAELRAGGAGRDGACAVREDRAGTRPRSAALNHKHQRPPTTAGDPSRQEKFWRQEITNWGGAF